MRRRARSARSLALAVGALGLAGGTFVSAVFLAYRRLARVQVGCPEFAASNTPASFSLGGLAESAPAFDVSHYLMPGSEEVALPSLDPGITLHGWWVPSPFGPSAPAVVVVHGAGSCRRDALILAPAGMLHRLGYNVLLPDLRNHGSSTRTDGLHSAGTREHRDVLAAWEWAVRSKGLAPERIGLLGISMGGGAVTIAMAHEPRVPAAWIDGVFADMRNAAVDESRRGGLPGWLVPAGFAVLRRFAGVDFAGSGPLSAVPAIAGRPFFIAHGAEDPRVSVRHAALLADAFAAAGAPVEPWVIPGAAHCRGPLVAPDEYEARLGAFFGLAIGVPREG